MMNQFLVESSTAIAASAAGISSPIASPSAPVSAAGAVSTDVSSSGTRSSGIRPPLFRKCVQQLLDAGIHHGVDHEKVRRKSKHGDDHHAGGRTHLFPGGPRNAFHLELQILEILFDLRRPTGDLLRHAQFFCHSYFSLGTSAVEPAPLAPIASNPPERWQGRRDSNPHSRFWRPLVCR